MNIHFYPENFELLEYYSYPCCVIERIVEFEEGITTPRGDRGVKNFFESVLEEAREITGKRLMDNKIAFKIKHKRTGYIFYVGYKDNIWCLGLDLSPNMKSCFTIDLVNYEKN